VRRWNDTILAESGFILMLAIWNILQISVIIIIIIIISSSSSSSSSSTSSSSSILGDLLLKFWFCLH
jgi:hypothetical protein